MPLSVQYIWASSILVQLSVLLLLFVVGNFRKIPFFSAYITLNLFQAGFLLILGVIPGLSSAAYLDMAWASEGVTLVAQALATTEILRLTLKPYPGIWGLGWRLLAATSSFVVLIVVLFSHARTVEEKLFQLNRGYHLTFASAVIACLFLIRHYSIQVPGAFKLILGGFCLNSCVEVLIYTFIQILFHKGYSVHQVAWQIVSMVSFLAALILWVVALRKPFPVDDREAASPTDAGYQRLSPEINERLRELNEKLLRLWKMEARPE